VVVAPADAAAGPWTVPAAARAVGADADATSLGTQVSVHLLERLQTYEAGGGRAVKTVMVIEGTGGAIAADETDEMVAQDGAPATMAMKAPADIVLAPLTPPRAFAENDSLVELDYKGPLLFLVHFESKGEKRDLAIAKDRDTLAIWTMVAPSDSIDVPPEWEQTGTIKLAPGTTVIAPPVAGAAPAVAVGSAAAAPVDANAALDAALAAKHVKRSAVQKRITSATSAWAVIVDKANKAGEVLQLEVLASRPDGIAEIRLAPPKPGTFGDVVSFEAKDLDGDGSDEGVLVVGWTRITTIPGEQDGWQVYTLEEARQLYVLAGAAPTLRPAFAHVVSYETSSEGVPEENVTPYPEPESVTYDWSVATGKPALVKLTRTKSEVAARDRLRGVLDPASDPLFAAGSGKDIPLDLH
jgi:hypothetical protein